MINFTIFISLCLVNFLYIFFSNRKRRYGLLATKIFLALFLGYWVYYVYILNHNHTSQVQSITDKMGSINDPNSAGHFQIHNLEQEAIIKKQFKNLDHLLNATLIQGFIVIAFAIIGLLTITNRTKYYRTTLIVNSLLMMLMVWVFLMGHI